MTGDGKCVTAHVHTRQFGDLNGVRVALQAETSQALPAVLVGKVEVPHQVLCGCLLHVQLISILLVEETHFLQRDRTLKLQTLHELVLPRIESNINNKSLTKR